MSVSIPFVRQTNWLSSIPQLLLMGMFMASFYLAGSKEYFLYGAATYLVVSLVLKNALAKQHRLGIRLVKQNRFIDAIPCFSKSYSFFTRNEWVDKYRFLTMLSSSQMNYREMALCNIGFCYGQVGNRQQAIEYYEKALLEYPESGLAKASLAMLKAE